MPASMDLPTMLSAQEINAVGNSLAFMGRTLSRWAHIRKMAWLMPRMQCAVPYLGYIVVAGVKNRT